MHMLQEQLKNIGLSDHEALVLSVLIPHSPSSASHIAKKTNLSRSSVYTVLSALTEKGLVATTHKNEVKQFVAQDFESMKQLLAVEEQKLDSKLQALEEVKETLTTIDQTPAHVPNVTFFEGQEGLKRVYMNMMRSARKGDMLYLLRDEFVWSDDWKFIFEEEWSSRVARIKAEKNIHTRLLVNHSNVEKKAVSIYQAKKGLEYRFVPKEYSISAFAIYIIGDMVAVMSMETGNLMGTLVTNQNVAHNYTQLFKNLWSHARNTH